MQRGTRREILAFRQCGLTAAREGHFMPTASLSFTIGIARDLPTLREACGVRARAYGHHLGDQPGLAGALAEPDDTDLAPGTAVLVCRDKTGGHVIGTARIQRNHPRPLPIEGCIELPALLADHARAEITRLAILPGADHLVRPMLVKACWMYAVAAQIRTLVIGARSAALVRIYKGLGFQDLLADETGSRQVPLAHAGGLPHHVLAFDVVSAERHWHASRHALYGFMVETWHPDLQLIADASPALRPAAVASTATRIRPSVAPARPQRLTAAVLGLRRRRAAPTTAGHA